MTTPATQAHDRIAESICQTVAEIPDRSSPDDWPEAMLVTADELHTIIVCALENEAERQAHSLPGNVGMRDSVFEHLVSAYRQGALDVHNEWIKLDLNEGLSDDPDFTEAAHDYAHNNILAALTPSALSGDALAKGLRTSQKALDEIARQEQANIAGYLALRDFPIGSASTEGEGE